MLEENGIAVRQIKFISNAGKKYKQNEYIRITFYKTKPKKQKQNKRACLKKTSQKDLPTKNNQNDLLTKLVDWSIGLFHMTLLIKKVIKKPARISKRTVGEH